MPKLSFACHNKNGGVENCCEKHENNYKKSNSTCCCHQSKNNSKDGCKGNCGQNSCHCAPIPLVALHNSITTKHLICPGSKKQYYLVDFVLSSGFYSIWLPPKIS